MEEIWKDIPGYEGLYQVSNLGKVKSLKRYIRNFRNGKNLIEERILRFNPQTKYPRVTLCKNGEVNNVMIHRVVAKMFVKNPKNKPQVNHIDGDPTNNIYTNLEWCTQAENNQHAYDVGLKKGPIGEKQGRSKLKEHQVIEIRKLNGKMTHQKIADIYNVSRQCITDILRRRSWKHI